MARTFLTLVGVNGLALLLSFATGVVSKLRDGVLDSNDPTFHIHFLLGLFTAIGTLLVHCLIFTYFLGTGRWVKEVGLAYALPDAGLPKLTRELKRQTFPPALAAMLVTIAAAAAGAAAQLRVWPWGVHAALATAALAVNVWAFRVEFRNLAINANALEEVMREVERIRAARGLPSNGEALRQDEAGTRATADVSFPGPS